MTTTASGNSGARTRGVDDEPTTDPAPTTIAAKIGRPRSTRGVGPDVTASSIIAVSMPVRYVVDTPARVG